MHYYNADNINRLEKVNLRILSSLFPTPFVFQSGAASESVINGSIPSIALLFSSLLLFSYNWNVYFQIDKPICYKLHSQYMSLSQSQSPMMVIIFMAIPKLNFRWRNHVLCGCNMMVGNLFSNASFYNQKASLKQFSRPIKVWWCDVVCQFISFPASSIQNT